MIKVRNLTKVYHKGNEYLTVLDNIDFDLSAGEFAMVLGESGTGKTTLLNFIGALDQPDSGKIIIERTGDILKISDRELSHYRNRMVGHIFQTFNLKPTYTAYENVRVPLLFTRMSKTEQNKRIEKALDAVGLSRRKSFQPIELSEGQCQRVAIARAIVSEPRILLADEPTGNLDPKTAESIMNLLIDLNRNSNMLLLMVTHDLDVIKNAHKVFVLAEGHLKEDSREYLCEKKEKNIERSI
jgi:putative ABC transport system ATP-binding protein